MALDREELDDTYDLLSPVRRSNSYSDRFESSVTGRTSDTFNSSSEVTYSPPGSLKSPSFTSPSRLHAPKYTSTAKYQGKNNLPPPPVQSKTRKKQVVRHTSPVKARSSHDTTKDLMRIPEDGGGKELSVWEDWLIRKVQEERENIKLKKMSERAAQLEQEKLEKEKEDKKRQAEINRQQWCERKMLKEKLQRAMQRREELLKKELKAQEQEQINRKAREAYEKWLIKQQEIEHEQKQKEEDRKQQELREKEERKRRNEECFLEWLKKANERKPASPRPKSGAPNDYPAPTFRNPAPWIGPMSDRDTRESVRRQHRMMIAEKHETIRKNRGRPLTAPRQRKGLVTTGPPRGKGVLICRPATAAPLFHNIPARNNKKFVPETERPPRGRS